MLQKSPASPDSASETAPDSDVAAVLASGRRHPRRRLIAIGAAVLAVLAAAGFWLTSGSGGSAVTYTTQPVTSGDLTVNVVATGTVQPTNQVSISSELSGTVRTVLVDYNQTVKQGQVLAQLDTDKLNANLALAKATLAARQADVLQAQATVDQTAAVLTRTIDLAGRGVSASQTLETAQADSDRAKAALASAKANQQIAEANVSIAETDLSKSEIKSPIDGVVLSRAVDPGQIVASSLSAPVLFTLAEDLSEMQLQVGIDEADMGKVKQGDTATFTVEAFPGKKFPATISEIRYSPATVEGVVTYTAVLTVDNAELLLRPGMTATAEITVETVKDAILVPNAALRYAPPVTTTTSRQGAGLLGLLMPARPSRQQPTATGADGTRRLYVLRDGEPVAVSVKVGASDGTHTVVTGDLTTKDVVIVGSKTAS